MENFFPTKTSSVDETIAFGQQVGLRLTTESTVALHGELGSGKTHFVKGIAASKGVSQDVVSSPTFSLLNVYEAESSIFHFDLYRIKEQRELLEMGLDEYIHGEAIVVIEWPDIAQSFLPDDTIHIYVEHAGADTRLFSLGDD